MTEEENYAYELELQQQEEEQEDKFFEKIKDESMDNLCKALDTNRNVEWLLQYFLEQRNLYPENHKECINRTNKKLNMEKQDGK